MPDQDQRAYARRLVADVLATAEAENATAPETFTRRVMEELEQAGEVENTFVAYHRTIGVEAAGYGANESANTLDLFITWFRQHPLEERLPRSQAETLLRRLTSFIRRCQDGLRRHVDESSDVYDMCLAVEKSLTEVSRIRLFLLTNCVYSGPALPPSEFDGLPVSHEIWDVSRLHRMATSGTLSEPIVVDLDPPLPCLATSQEHEDYAVLLAILPGRELADLYGRYGTRLLELNVRSFLQTRGAVNKGIRNTLLHDPDRFLAYNNGISATASKVDFTEAPSGGRAISRIHDLQIVNGGQTTASIHFAHVRDKADLGKVHVQMKLAVVAPERLQEIVPEISRYSNTQNKVTLVDFSSNHPFHVAVEKVTRSLWAPAADGSGQETRWFYERARGQYADALARERTPANQRRFKVIHPSRQKFGKSDLAKYVHSWGQLPHLVSRGAEKNFREFMLRLGDDIPQVGVTYCQRLIAKAILFKSTDRIAAEHQAGSYKSIITTYTVARLSRATGQRIDLDRVWREQRISPALTAAINDLCPLVQETVTTPLRGNHVGEWAKRPECWDAVLGTQWDVPETLAVELVLSPVEEDNPTPEIDAGRSDAARVMAVPATEWFAVARWAKETQNLQPWQRQIAFTIGRYLDNGWMVSEKQAVQALRLMDEACRLGFALTVDMG